MGVQPSSSNINIHFIEQEHIVSQWRGFRQNTSQATVQQQTDATDLQDAESQAPMRHNMEVQAQMTENIEEEDPELASLLEDEDLARDAQQTALEGGDDDDNMALSHRYTLNPFDAKQGLANKSDLMVMGLAWHPKGLSVAAVFGVPFRVGYCTLPGMLALWNLSREQFDPSKPQSRVETDCALQAVAYNPAYPSLIAAGSANGDVFVWDMSREDEDREIGKSGSSTVDVMHREAVRSITWVHSSDEASRFTEKARAFLICTVGRDGRVLLWRWHNCKLPIYGMCVVNPMQKVPMGLHAATFPTQAATKQGFSQAVALTRIAADTVYKVGTEAGHIYDCSLKLPPTDMAEWESYTATDPADKKRRKADVEWRPANLSTSVQHSKLGKLPHSGAVTLLELCPSMQQVLLSAGLDGRVRLWGPGLEELLLLEPFDVGVTAGAWAGQNPAVFVVGSQDGRLAVFDLSTNRFKAVETVDVIGLDQPICAVSFCHSSQFPGWLAVSNVDTVSVYRLSARLSGGPRTMRRNAGHIAQLLQQKRANVAFV